MREVGKNVIASLFCEAISPGVACQVFATCCICRDYFAQNDELVNGCVSHPLAPSEEGVRLIASLRSQRRIRGGCVPHPLARLDSTAEKIPITYRMGSVNLSSRAKRGLPQKRSGWGNLQFIGMDKGLKADCHDPLPKLAAFL